MYSLNARDHFNCSPLLFSWPAPQNRCGQTEGGGADRQTDGRTDGQTEMIKQYCALHAMAVARWRAIKKRDKGDVGVWTRGPRQRSSCIPLAHTDCRSTYTNTTWEGFAVKLHETWRHKRQESRRMNSQRSKLLSNNYQQFTRNLILVRLPILTTDTNDTCSVFF